MWVKFYTLNIVTKFSFDPQTEHRLTKMLNESLPMVKIFQ